MRTKKSKFTEEQVLDILKQEENGLNEKEICRKQGISSTTFYSWRNKYAGMDVHELRRVRSLEEENSRLKKIMARQRLEIDMIKDLLSKLG